MPSDPFAARLATLLETGSLPASMLSRRARAELGSLFRTGVLDERRSGRGSRVEVRDETALRRWIAGRYPTGLDPDLAHVTPRAAAVARVAHSKRGDRLAAEPVLFRGFGDARLTSATDTLPLAELTRRFGVAGLLLRDDGPWRASGTVAVVENAEVFLHIEDVVGNLDVDVAILAAGRLSGRALTWLAAQDDADLVHLGDYDPVGLDEYLRLRERVGARARLFVPDDLDALVARYGRADLLRKPPGLLAGVRTRADAAVTDVLRTLDRHGRALEQEALLLPPP